VRAGIDDWSAVASKMLPGLAENKDDRGEVGGRLRVFVAHTSPPRRTWPSTQHPAVSESLPVEWASELQGNVIGVNARFVQHKT
jgi:hypothetical protein